MKDTKKAIQSLEDLLQASVSPFHTIKKSMERLSAAGFTELTAAESWKVEPGKSYYVNLYDSSLIAFSVGSAVSRDKAPMIRMAASHTDWPCLRVKPYPEIIKEGYGQLNVECYGGMLLQTWLDRPLSMAGRVCVRGNDPFEPEVKFVDFKRPLLMVPNLANHIKREPEKGAEPNKQTDMLPIITQVKDKLEDGDFFLTLLAGEIGVEKSEILDYEFYIYNAEHGTLWGINEEFYSAPRLDNITSVEACVTGLLSASSCGKNNDTISLIALYDNEEVGSRTKQGANSTAIDRIMEKLYLALGYDRDQYLSAMFKSYLLSMDVAHAYHPSKPNNYDLKNHPCMNDGVVIKMSSTQTYATDSTAVSVLEELCRKDEIPYRKFSNRSDIRGGSTLGSISSCALAVKAADIGVGLLAMHSAMETMGADDQWAINSLTKAFFEG